MEVDVNSVLAKVDFEPALLSISDVSAWLRTPVSIFNPDEVLAEMAKAVSVMLIVFGAVCRVFPVSIIDRLLIVAFISCMLAVPETISECAIELFKKTSDK